MTQSKANNILSGIIQHSSSEDTLDDHRVSHTCNNMVCEKKWDPQQAVKKAERPEEIWNGHLIFRHYHGMSWSKTNTRALWSRGSKMFLRKFVWSKQLVFPRSASQCNAKRHLREHYPGNILGVQTVPCQVIWRFWGKDKCLRFMWNWRRGHFLWWVCACHKLVCIKVSAPHMPCLFAQVISRARGWGLVMSRWWEQKVSNLQTVQKPKGDVTEITSICTCIVWLIRNSSAEQLWFVLN